MFALLSRLNGLVSRCCMYVAVAGLIGIVAVVAIQVFGRYVLNDTPTWAESMALVLVIYVTMLGAAVGVRDAGHIGLESLLVRFPLRHGNDARASLYARALEAAGRLAALQGDLAAARALQERALEILEPIEDQAGMLPVLEGLAFVANLQGDCDAAGAYLDRSLRLAPAVNGFSDIAPTLANIRGAAIASGRPVRTASS